MTACTKFRKQQNAYKNTKQKHLSNIEKNKVNMHNSWASLRGIKR